MLDHRPLIEHLRECFNAHPVQCAVLLDQGCNVSFITKLSPWVVTVSLNFQPDKALGAYDFDFEVVVYLGLLQESETNRAICTKDINGDLPGKLDHLTRLSKKREPIGEHQLLELQPMAAID